MVPLETFSSTLRYQPERNSIWRILRIRQDAGAGGGQKNLAVFAFWDFFSIELFVACTRSSQCKHKISRRCTMSDPGFAVFLWLGISFSCMYAIVLSAFIFLMRHKPVEARQIDESKRRPFNSQVEYQRLPRIRL